MFWGLSSGGGLCVGSTIAGMLAMPCDVGGAATPFCEPLNVQAVAIERSQSQISMFP